MLKDVSALCYGFFCGIAVLQKASIDDNNGMNVKSDVVTSNNISIALEENNDDTPRDTKAKNKIILQRKPFYFVSCGLLFSFFALGLVDGESSPCPWCERTTCVPFPPWASMERKWWHCDSCEAATYSTYFLEREDDDDDGYNSYRQYGGMLLTCPDDTMKKIDVELYNVFDVKWFKKNVRMFCHYQCGGVKQKAYYPQQNDDDNMNYNNRNGNYNNRNGNYNNKNGNYNNGNYNQNGGKKNNTIIETPMRK